jgi:hypothetical protein
MKYIKLFEYEWFLGSQTYDSIRKIDGEFDITNGDNIDEVNIYKNN